MFNTLRKIALPSLVLSSFLMADSIESRDSKIDSIESNGSLARERVAAA